jgi:REP element-mobilizing transposase RayT
MIPSRHTQIREKRHRLPREYYRGEVTVAFTACVENSQPLFVHAHVVRLFTEHLRNAVRKHDCVVFIYCFMPEHQHLIVHGNSPQADTWRAMVDYKQQTGFWLGQHRPEVKWQKDFYRSHPPRR